jgi:hypothetical protein
MTPHIAPEIGNRGHCRGIHHATSRESESSDIDIIYHIVRITATERNPKYAGPKLQAQNMQAQNMQAQNMQAQNMQAQICRRGALKIPPACRPKFPTRLRATNPCAFQPRSRSNWACPT